MKKHISGKYEYEKSKAEEKSTVNVKMQSIIDKAVEKAMSSKSNQDHSQRKSNQDLKR
jgi:hypothetical protein